MATSNSRDFIQTRNDIIKSALRKLKAIEQGEEPTPEKTNGAAHALNSMVLSWHNEGIFLWTLADVTQTLTHSVETYSTVSAAVMGIENPYIRRDDLDFPLASITKEEYDNINNKSQEGKPNKIYFFRGLSSYTIYLWPVPENSSDILHYVNIVRLQDFDTAADNPDFPVEWSNALIFGLAAVLAPEYISDINFLNYLLKMAEYYKKLSFDSSQQGGSLKVAPYLRRK
jgi:hypothetical protein